MTAEKCPVCRQPLPRHTADAGCLYCRHRCATDKRYAEWYARQMQIKGKR